jgi:hypothetical protein
MGLRGVLPAELPRGGLGGSAAALPRPFDPSPAAASAAAAAAASGCVGAPPLLSDLLLARRIEPPAEPVLALKPPWLLLREAAAEGLRCLKMGEARSTAA